MSTLKGALWSTRTMVFSGLHVSYNKSSVSGLALIRQARLPGGGLRSELVLDIFYPSARCNTIGVFCTSEVKHCLFYSVIKHFLKTYDEKLVSEKQKKIAKKKKVLFHARASTPTPTAVQPRLLISNILDI